MHETERGVIKILKKHKIDVVSTLPCEKMSALFRLVERESREVGEVRETGETGEAGEQRGFCSVGLNREENGVGISAGVYLAGGKPLMLIQSTGLGNSFNALLSLTVTYGLPLPIIASWRGVYKEKIEAQVAFGRALPGVLDAFGLKYTVIEDPSAVVGSVEEVVLDAFANERPHVALVSPRAWENGTGTAAAEETAEETAEEAVPPQVRESAFKLQKGKEREFKAPEMRRFDAIKIISEYLGEDEEAEAVVSNIGVPSKELYAVKDRALNFYMLGSLGQATPVGLGVALKTRREVAVLDGDGSLQMSNILPVVAEKKPKNFSIFCLDNGTWGSTGDQPTPSSSAAGDLELTAVSAGVENTAKVRTEAELRSALERLYEEAGPRFLHILVRPGSAEEGNIKLSAEQIKRRFMAACSRLPRE
ncbi:MAG: sulfopyruvate decarboxylase subunit alpha [Candidatus Methanospirareceae archaeon]